MALALARARGFCGRVRLWTLVGIDGGMVGTARDAGQRALAP